MRKIALLISLAKKLETNVSGVEIFLGKEALPKKH